MDNEYIKKLDAEFEIDYATMDQYYFDESFRKYVRLAYVSPAMRVALRRVWKNHGSLCSYTERPVCRYTHNGPSDRWVVEQIMSLLYKAKSAKSLKEFYALRAEAYAIAVKYQHYVWYDYFRETFNC